MDVVPTAVFIGFPCYIILATMHIIVLLLQKYVEASDAEMLQSLSGVL